MRTIKKLIIHCSDSDYAHHDNVAAIRHWHVKERGFSDVGYHFIITKDGEVHFCRPVHISGAHCRGHNSSSIGICLTGKKEFSEKQKESLKLLVDNLKIEFGLASDAVYPHNHFDNSKTCPNFDIYEII